MTSINDDQSAQTIDRRNQVGRGQAANTLCGHVLGWEVIALNIQNWVSSLADIFADLVHRVWVD
jgi:hypothetical protein